MPNVRRVASRELHRAFNDGRYYERVCSNELLATVESEHRAPSEAGQPPGTMSQLVVYFDPADLRHPVARVHQYLLPDGTLGGSGRPDPKRLFVGGEVWFC
jgi:hypothetical protein